MDDRHLIEESLKDNTSCFEQLVFRYEKQLMRFLVLRCESISDAEDVFQETFLNAHRYLKTFDNRFKFSTWLFNIALNILKRHYTINKPIYDQALIENTHDVSIEKNTQAPSLENSVGDKENLWYFAKQYLDEEQLNLLWFTYAEGYTGNEVAHLLNRSSAWVKINLIRVKSHLKSKLKIDKQTLSDLVAGNENAR